MNSIPIKQIRRLREINDSFSPVVSLNNSNKNCLLKTKSFRFENPKIVIIGHLNMNSFRNKFKLPKSFIYNAFVIFLVLDIKIDSSFPLREFCLAGYMMLRLDRNSYRESLACMSRKSFL